MSYIIIQQVNVMPNAQEWDCIIFRGVPKGQDRDHKILCSPSPKDVPQTMQFWENLTMLKIFKLTSIDGRCTMTGGHE